MGIYPPPKLGHLRRHDVPDGQSRRIFRVRRRSAYRPIADMPAPAGNGREVPIATPSALGPARVLPLLPESAT